MPTINCPECGTTTELPAIRRSADEFCPHCDYPLFWVSSAVEATQRGGNSDATLRRLPGAGGRHRIGSKECPDCGELNAAEAEFCIRCGADFNPPPPAPPPEPIVAPPVVAPPPELPATRWWIPVVAVAVVAAVLAAMWWWF